MKTEDIDRMLSGIDPPRAEGILHQEELKIPLLRYRRSSRMGLWLLVVPIIAAVMIVVRRELAISSVILDYIGGALAAVAGNSVLNFLIPIIFIGLPCTSMLINLLAFTHFAVGNDRKELLVTIKVRPVNIAVFLLSFAVLVFFLMPDMMSF